MLRALNDYSVEMVSVPKMISKMGKYKCRNSIKIKLGDFILTCKYEAPVIVKEIANTLTCYSIRNKDDKCEWYKFPYLINGSDTEFVRKLKMIQIIVKDYDLKQTNLYVGESFMYFTKTNDALAYTCYMRTEIPGIYIFTEVLDDVCTKKFVVLTNDEYHNKDSKYFMRNIDMVATHSDTEKVKQIKPYIDQLRK